MLFPYATAKNKVSGEFGQNGETVARGRFPVNLGPGPSSLGPAVGPSGRRHIGTRAVKSFLHHFLGTLLFLCYFLTGQARSFAEGVFLSILFVHTSKRMEEYLQGNPYRECHYFLPRSPKTPLPYLHLYRSRRQLEIVITFSISKIRA